MSDTTCRVRRNADLGDKIARMSGRNQWGWRRPSGAPMPSYASRRSSRRLPCDAQTFVVKKGESKSREIENPRIHVYMYVYINSITARDKSFEQTRLICVQSKIDHADGCIGAWSIMIISCIAYRNFYTRAGTHICNRDILHDILRDILRLYLLSPSLLRSNLHSHWIAMQIARMQIATR